MTGEAQCEERKGTLAWHHIYTSFNPHRQCVKVTFYGLKSAIKTHSVWPSSHIFILKPNQSIWFATTSFYNIVISWYDCTKEENTLETGLLPLNSKFKLHIFNTGNHQVCFCVHASQSLVSTFWDWAWIPISQEKSKWSIITSSILPLFPFQHYTELRYQLTHYPLSPGDW